MMNNGISIIVMLSVPTGDGWHSQLYSAISKDANKTSVDQVTEVLKTYHDKNNVGRIRYYPVDSKITVFSKKSVLMWNDGLNEKELEEYLYD